MKKIGLGITSYAHPHAPKYATAIAACPCANLVGITGLGINVESAEAEAKKLGIPCYYDYLELLRRDELDGVYIGTEPNRHLEVVAAAAAQGKHVLCDKPIALTLGEADDIIQAAERPGSN